MAGRSARIFLIIGLGGVALVVGLRAAGRPIPAAEPPAAAEFTAPISSDVTPAPVAPAPAPSPAGALEPLQIQWRVADFAVAASQVSEWVGARQGWAVATNEHHLSIKLPASAVPEFLQRVGEGSAEGRSPRPTDPPAAPDPAQPLWITISLELVIAP